MSSELSVKEFYFIYYLLFSHNSCDHFASAPFLRYQFKRPNAPDAPDRSPSTSIVCISASLHLMEEGDLHRDNRGGMMMGLYIGGRGGGWHDDDGEGWHGDTMTLALHLGVDRHFRIRIISLDTVSLWVLGNPDNLPPRCTKEPLMVLGDCRRSFINLSSSVVDEDILFIELMHISKASDLFSWRRTFCVAVFFAVIFFASSISLLFVASCLHCATLEAVR